MPGSFVSSQPVRVELPDRPDEWIDIKSKLSEGDRKNFVRKTLETEMVEAVEKARFRPLVWEFSEALLRCAIIDWRLLDEHGLPVPYNPEKIAMLDLDDPLVDATLREIIQRNPFLRTRANTASG